MVVHFPGFHFFTFKCIAASDKRFDSFFFTFIKFLFSTNFLRLPYFFANSFLINFQFSNKWRKVSVKVQIKKYFLQLIMRKIEIFAIFIEIFFIKVWKWWFHSEMENVSWICFVLVFIFSFTNVLFWFSFSIPTIFCENFHLFSFQP